MKRTASKAFPVLSVAVCFAGTAKTGAQSLPESGLRLEPEFEVTTTWHRTQKVFALAQTPDGYLWAGTDGGLLRYDGKDFQTFTKNTSPGLHGNVVRSLAVDDNNSLWIGLDEGRGLARLEERTISAIDTGAGLKDRTVTVLTWDKTDHSLLVGMDQGLCRYRPQVHGQCEAIATLAREEIFALSSGDDGVVFVGAKGGLFRLVAGGATRVGTHGAVLAVARDRKGQVWFSDSSAGLFHQASPSAHEELLLATDTTAKNRRAFNTVGVDAVGALWVGWSWGYGRVVGHELDPSLSTGMHTNGLLSDTEGGLWSATHWGVVSRLGRPHAATQTYNASNELPLVFSVARSSDGAIWMSQIQSLVRVDGAGSTRWEVGKTLPVWCPRSIAPSVFGGVWLGSCDAGLVRIRDGVVAHLGKNFPKAARNVQSVFEDRNHTVWFGTEPGDLFRLDGEMPVEVPFTNGRCSDNNTQKVVPDECSFSITDMKDARAGGIWAATRRNGLRLIQDGKTTVFTRQQGLPTDELNAVYEDAAGTLWIGTQAQGLVRFKGGQFKTVDAGAGLPAQSIHGITEDDAGQLWMSSENGVFRVLKKDLDQYFDGGRVSVEGHSYGIEDGLKSLITVQAFPPSIIITPERRVLVPTDRGLAIVRADRIVETSGFSSPIVEEVRVDGVEYNSARAIRLDLQMGQAGIGSLEFRLSLPNYTVPHRVGLLYRLNGYETGWRSTVSDRTLRYQNIPAGNYVFEARAQLDGEAWGKVASLPPIAVRGFMQQPIFFLILASGVLLAFGLFYTAHLLNQRRRFGMVLAERNRIARDLHDSLAQYFTAIAFQLERIAMTMRSSPDEASQINEQTKQMLRQARLEARHSIHDLRSEQLVQRTLGDCLQSMVDETRLLGRSHLTYEQIGEDRYVGDHLQRQIIRIAQEATVNAVTHANAENIFVRGEFEGHEVCLQIVDDGIGIDPNNIPPLHHGLRGMRERAAEIGGTLAISSPEGEGTMVELRIPV